MGIFKLNMETEPDNQKVFYTNTASELDLESLIKELEADNIKNIKKGNYDDAEKQKKKIDSLKLKLKQKKKKNLDNLHFNELQNLDSSQKREMDGLENYWNLQFTEMENKSMKFESDLEDKHKKEMESLLNNLDEKLPKNIKYSKNYLELKSQEENLI